MRVVRAALARESSRPAITQGVRTAVVTIAPIVAADVMGQPGLFAWVSLGGFQSSIADNGGPYRVRAASMVAVVLGGGLACFIGSLAGLSPWLTIPVTFAAGMFSGLVRVFGDNGSAVGLNNLVIYLVAVGWPLSGVAAAGQRTLLFVIGATAAALLTLVLWPFQPYLPSRRAIAQVWRLIAQRLATGAPGNPVIRTAIERARQELLAVRGAREGHTGRGEALLATLVSAERVLGILVAMPELIETAGVESPLVTQLIDTLNAEMAVGAEAARGIDSATERLALPRLLPRARLIDAFVVPFLGALSPKSLVFRHAVRLAIGVTVAHILSTMMGLQRGYWMTLTTAVILQPYAGATLSRMWQRVIGTVIGGVLAGVLSAAGHNPILNFAVLFPLCVVTIAVRPIGYGYYVLFLTPLFVMIAEGAHTDAHLAVVRVLNTILGGAVAFVISTVLWPEWEGDTLPHVLAEAVDAGRAYLRVVLSGAATAGEARRAAGLANINAEAVLQRVLSEGKRASPLTASGIEMVAFLRRLSQTLSALTAIHPARVAEPFANAADAELAAVASVLRTGKSVPGVAAVANLVPADVPSPAVAALLARVARQVDVLYATATTEPLS